MKMKHLTFFRQKRVDGSVRTGVELDELRMLESFEAGSPDEDPTLLWWIDVRCAHKTFPLDPEELRAWLLKNAPKFEKALKDYAAELGAGIDINWPVKHTVPGDAGVKMQIFCSAMQRVAGREIPTELAELANHWQSIIAELPSNELLVAD
jgi:hypothetical protein